MMLGPVLGSVLYTFLAFEWTFYVFAFILTIIFVITLVMLPSELDKYCEDGCKGMLDPLSKRPQHLL